MDQKGQQIALEGYFRWEWVDPRLAHNDDCGQITMQLPVDDVWQPDIYIDNTLSEWYGAGSLIVYPDGRVSYSCLVGSGGRHPAVVLQEPPMIV